MSIKSSFLTLSGPIAAYPTDPDFDAGFAGTAAVALYGEGDVYFSFDGIEDHGRVKLDSTSLVPSMKCDYSNYRKVWFRTPSVSVEVGVVIESSPA